VQGGEARRQVAAEMEERGLAFSGLAANLWGEHLIDTDDPTPYIAEFKKNCGFCVDLGIRGIRVDTVQPPTIVDELGHETVFARVTSTFKRCNEIAKDHGCT
jgi:sugar phosphate isomerase/epimerase